MAQNRSSAVMARRDEAPDSLDYFPTHPWATRAFIQHVMKPLGLYRPDLTVWEPACGEGHMVIVLSDEFAVTHASDVFDYGRGFPVFDFLSLANTLETVEPPFGRPDWIITNPPFKCLQLFLELALAVATDGVALFGRISLLEGGDRFAGLWQPWRRHAVYAQYVERVPIVKGRLDPKAKSATAYGWLVIDKRRPFPETLPGFGVTAIPTVFIPPCRAELVRPGDYREEWAAA